MKNLLNNWMYNAVINLTVGILFIFIADKQVWWMYFFGLFFIFRAIFNIVGSSQNDAIPLNKDKSQN
ncbi:hypothetical protein [Chryseobacterium sp.]|uniref:hypothetical protein n=1 Tax=Chryseobacterium sp. TaxID=1871047 RepID=UPI0011CC102E|nr:hypothetical protein [Chryseobacterium sp.]TXF75910.1 hypothetical protein FUA25_08370 [Chryseobacterium sp.]